MLGWIQQSWETKKKHKTYLFYTLVMNNQKDQFHLSALKIIKYLGTV